jgi:hypothetical protein
MDSAASQFVRYMELYPSASLNPFIYSPEFPEFSTLLSTFPLIAVNLPMRRTLGNRPLLEAPRSGRWLDGVSSCANGYFRSRFFRRTQHTSRLMRSAMRMIPPTPAPTSMPILAVVESPVSPRLSTEIGAVAVGPVDVPGVYPAEGVAGGRKLFCQRMLLPRTAGRLAYATSDKLPAYRTDSCEQVDVQFFVGMFHKLSDLSAHPQAVQFVTSEVLLLLFRFLQLWVMPTHS